MKGKRIFKRLTAVLTALLVTITGLPGFELVSAADIEPIVHVADAPTIDGWKDVFLHADSNTENAGGIWVDKSVFDTSASFDGRTVALSDENNFLVSLSAIASTKSITGYSYIPTDTVLVLDISGSMFSSTTSESTARSSKAARMIEAANQAIKSLLANNNNNRIGIILYSSSGMEFLPIDRYSVDNPANDNYLEYEFTTTTDRRGRVTYAGIKLVTGDTLKDSNNNAVSKEVTVTGGTYIQAGVEFAGDYLTSADTTVDGGSFQAGVTRMPIIVLMSDGAATYGTASYTDIDSGKRGGPGNGNGNAGLAFVNQLTAVYTLKRVEEHYGTNALLYTLGVGVNDSEYAVSVLNPSGSGASQDVADLWELYDKLGNNSTLSVTLGGNSNSNQTVRKYTPATANGFTVSSADRFYVDRYFSASTASDITAAFKSIVDQIIIQSKYYPTYVTDGDHHLDGDITFKDEIGRYMEVKEVKGVLLGSTLFSGEAVAKAMNEGDLGTISQPTPLGDELSRSVQKRIGVDMRTAQFLIDEAYKAGQLYYNEETGEYSNYIGWYANADGSYAGFWNGDENMATRPAGAVYANRSYGFMGVTGTGISASDMMYLSVQVYTNIDTGFSTVLFRIPAALIPLISYDVSLDGTSYDDATNISVTRTGANPIRLVYEVGMRSDVNELTIKDVVDASYPYVDADGVYSFYSNRWVTDTHEHEEGHHPGDHHNTVAFYTPSEQNERYYYTENNVVYSDTNGTVYTGSSHPATTGGTYYRAYYVFSNNAAKNGIETRYEQIHHNTNDTAHSTLGQAKWDDENGNWYIPKGFIHRTTGSFFVGKPAANNNSGTYTFVRQPVVGMYNGTFYATAFLGNNGLITLEPAQGIRISKAIDGTVVPGTNTQFTFEIESTDPSENGTYRVIRFDTLGAETNEEIRFTSGKATIGLNNGDTVYILDLEAGDTFTVSEAKHVDYRVKSVNGDETATEVDITVVKHEISDADFVNAYIPKGLLVVSKTVKHTLSEGYAIDTEREYDITVSLGEELNNREFDAVVDNADGTTQNTKVTADANGDISISLKHGTSIAIEGIPAGTTYTVAEADYSAAGFVTDITAPTGTIVADDNSTVDVVNTYSPEGVTLEAIVHAGTKAIGGREWLDTDTFEFVLEKFNGTGYSKLGESKTVAYADVVNEIAGFGFDLSGEILTDIGEYRYKIREIAGDIGGMTYDESEYIITVTVTDETMDGKLEIKSVTSENAAVTFDNDKWQVETPFTNTYKARGGAEVSVTVNKVIEDADGAATNLSTEGYQFGIYDESGNLLDTLITDANGVAKGERTYTIDSIGQTYTYIIREVNTGVPGIVYSQEEYQFTVTVVDNLDGTIGADIKKRVSTLDDSEKVPNIELSFTNIYKPASIVLEGTKTLENREMVPGEFEFEVKEDGKVVATGTNTADGRIIFTEIEYSDVGTYTYTVNEVKGNNTTITYDEDTVNVTVNVTKDIDGSLIAALDDNSPAIEFENTYNLSSTAITLVGTKVLNGHEMEADEFEFEVKENDTVVSVGFNDAQGNIVFDEIEYTEAGDHTYTISEVNGGQTIGGVSYDDTEFTVTVNVTDNGDGTLTASVADGTAPIVFTNEYNVGKTSIILEGTKVLENKTLNAGDFTFIVMEGTTKVAEGANDAQGNIVFDEIEYTEAGDHTYTISEVNGGQTIGGVSYDDTEFTVTVNVTDNGDGTLTASVADGTAPVKFTNTYSVSGEASVTLTGTKVLDGRTMEDGEFEFEISENGTVVARGKNTENGEIVFEAITYTSAGEHTYVITEVKGNDKEITYDDTSYTVVVNVTDNGDGTISASVDANAPEIIFNNTYTYIDDNAYLTLRATKIYDNGTLKGGDFSFELKDEQGNVLQTMINDEQGNIVFDTITYTAEGGPYVYTVSEVKGDNSKVEYDDTVYTVTVTVTALPDGKLVANTVITNEAGEELNSMVFINEYEDTLPWPTDANIRIKAKKEVVGKDGESYKLDGFVFILENLTTGEVYNAVSDRNGDVEFRICFTIAEIGNTYEFELTESNTGLNDIIYDESAHRFNVQVTFIPPINKVDAYVYRLTDSGKETLRGPVATFVNVYDPYDEPEVEPEEAICDEEE